MDANQQASSSGASLHICVRSGGFKKIKRAPRGCFVYILIDTARRKNCMAADVSKIVTTTIIIVFLFLKICFIFGKH